MRIPDVFLKYVYEGGKYSLILAVFGVALNHWGFIKVSKYLLDFLYAYILLNGVSVSPFVYLERRKRVSQSACPKCGELLMITPQYVCPECGKLIFEK